MIPITVPYREPETVFVPQMFVPQMFVPQMLVPQMALKMGSHGNALAVSFFRRHARLRSLAHDFPYSIEKRCGKLGRYVSLNEIHVLCIY